MDASLTGNNSTKILTSSSDTKTFYKAWIIVVVVSFIIVLALNIIFVYIPVARIEDSIIKAANDIERVVQKVDNASTDVDIAARGVERLVIEIEQTISKLEAIFCNFFPTSPVCMNGVSTRQVMKKSRQ